MASYHEVNDSCNTLSAMVDFRNDIIVHERDHEAGLNACLSSGAARTMLDNIEKIVGDDSSTVTSAAQTSWSNFYNNSLNNSGLWARRFSGGSSFWNHAGGWRLGYPGIPDHGNVQHGC